MILNEPPAAILSALRTQINKLLGPAPTVDDYTTMAFYLEILAEEYDTLAGPDGPLEYELRPGAAELIERMLQQRAQPGDIPLVATA